VGAALLATGVVALLVVGWSLRPLPAAPTRDSFSTEATSLALSLADGSTLELGPGSSLRVATESERLVVLKLTRGGALFDVARRPDREFRVEVEDVSVVVVGTRFRVERRPDATVSVSVERGAVDVVRQGDRKRLGVGESWSLQPGPGPVTIPGELLRAEPEPSRDGVAADAGPVRGAAVSSRPRLGVPPRPALPTADDVFAEMVSLRRAARWAEAAEAATRFLGRFPNEPRAGLVSFELGRIEMDRLGAFADAAVRLRQASVLAPSGPFVEDALAREVRALNAAGDRAACLSRRAAFLERFPTGLHRASVESACK
jgi:transmembrane sensor